MIVSLSEIGKAIDEGRVTYSYYHKTSCPATTAGFFVDMNQTSGIPKYNAYPGTPLEATQLNGQGNNGIYCGQFDSSRKKYLAKWQSLSLTSSLSYLYLCDFLLFYPLIDGDSTDLQEFDNTQTLSRFTNGEGVKAICVITAPLVGTGVMTVNYTNQSGNSRSTSFGLVSSTSIGVCATATSTGGGSNRASPFIPLAAGDTGIRSIESIRLASASGGIVCIVLVKPILNNHSLEAIPQERFSGFQNIKIPEIVPGSFLNFLISRGGTTATDFRSEFIFVDI